MELTTTNNGAELMWIKSSASSVLSIGLERALKKRGTRIHRGPEPPLSDPSVVVYSPAGKDENVASEVQELKELAPEAAIVVFGTSADLSLARAAVQAGASGFLHVGMPPEQITRALKKAHNGEEVLPRELLGGLVAEMVAKEQGPDLSGLGARKVEILEMVAEGFSNSQIAKELYLSESTIKQHLRKAYKALGVKNRNQAARLMRRSAQKGSERPWWRFWRIAPTQYR